MREFGQRTAEAFDVGPELSQAFRVLSLICALLVVMIHVPVDLAIPDARLVSRVFHTGICRIAVPFFFAAGFFLAGSCKGQGWWRREVLKRCKSLLVPYAVFGIAYAVVMCGLVLWASNLYDPSHTRAENLAYVANPLNIVGLVPYDRPVLKLLWFVRGLFVFVILSPVLVWLSRDRFGLGFFLLTALCAFGADLARQMGFPSCWGEVFDMGMLPLGGLFHFSAGLFMRQHARVFGFLMSPCGILAGGVLAVLGLADFGGAMGSALLAVNVGILLFYLGCLSVLAKHPLALPASLLACAFPVYMVHRFLLLPIRLVSKVLTGSAKIPWCWHFVTSLVLFGLSVGLVLALRRIVPRTSKVVFGGR